MNRVKEEIKKIQSVRGFNVLKPILLTVVLLTGCSSYGTAFESRLSLIKGEPTEDVYEVFGNLEYLKNCLKFINPKELMFIKKGVLYIIPGGNNIAEIRLIQVAENLIRVEYRNRSFLNGGIFNINGYTEIIKDCISRQKIKGLKL